MLCTSIENFVYLLFHLSAQCLNIETKKIRYLQIFINLLEILWNLQKRFKRTPFWTTHRTRNFWTGFCGLSAWFFIKLKRRFDKIFISLSPFCSKASFIFLLKWAQKLVLGVIRVSKAIGRRNTNIKICDFFLVLFEWVSYHYLFPD